MGKNFSKGLVLLAVVVLVVCFFAFDLGQYLTLEYLKERREAFQNYYAAHQLLTIASYMVIYIITTALSLPGATILTLAGGAVFGVLTGTIIVSFASTIGATLAFLGARFLLREYVQTKFSERLKLINRGVEKDGAFYLFSMRLIPVVPFFVINLVMGLTPIRTLTFFFVSQVGMLAGTAVYVNAGTQLAQLDSVAGILSPKLLLSFVLLGIFPFLAKGVMGFVRRVQVFRKYRKPKSYDFNLLVIGAGAAGLVSSYIAAAVKAKVALVEKNKMGGDCLNTGCVPSKALIHSAKVVHSAKRSKEYGIRSMAVDFEFAEVMERVQKVIRKIEPHDSVERYTSLGVDCIQGTATIKTPFEVDVDGKTYTTKNIIVAAGGEPLVPAFPGLDQVKVHTAEDIWEIREKPNRMLILGGGPIGSELAQAFNRLGVKVTQVEMTGSILAKEDEDVAKFVIDRFKEEGVNVLTGHKAREFGRETDQQYMIAEHQGRAVRLDFDVCLMALGRVARTSGYGLENVGIGLTPQKTIDVDEFLQTSVPNIYVCGDAIAPYQFTHTAAHEAWFCAVNALFWPFKRFKADYRVIPWVTFTDPEVARVGLNEQEAKDQGVAYEVTRYGLDDLDRAIAEGEDYGMVKVLTVPGKDKILGASIVGHYAGELLTEFVAAMKGGYGLNRILGTIHPYPTLSEANKFAAGEWKKAHKPEKVLSYLQKFHAWRRS